MNTSYAPYEPALLPDAVTRYLQRSGENPDREAVASAFATDAVVEDAGSTYTGVSEIRDWIAGSSAEYTYTTTHIGQQQIGDAEWIVVGHLEGDFPGGTVDLRFHFTLEGDRIRSLVIAP
ncbi:nuclear transport factor 2 family protein [Microbacterium ulmi]|uniref:Nuclear transport factor 2 family protein n=1 Tax=Microbacterium ulmi TaxID=179095 RepID=A0A7Y2PZ09_9MICO|nr:nuclear transport factor 2 family protein [Microbacterium ulmi]NII68958.1 hypothetical protein [Microbacterium ulmi]NNH03941.1 nuclear transport factor 2 family protein [Microbacterium ulmi]